MIQHQTAVFSGMSDAISPLIQQYAARKAPHALLITGQVGVGKSTLALLLAQALLCRGESKPCGNCPDCVRAQTYSHTNLMVVQTEAKQRSVKVEQARALLAGLSTFPFSPGPRAIILEGLDEFTPQAQNALLKAIEEPDQASCFILTCQNERAVLSTICSRSQMLRLPVWSEQSVISVLVEKGIPQAEAGELAALAGGSPGKALEIRGNEKFWAVKALVDEAVFTAKGINGFPAASRRLKDEKDKADLILDYLEQKALRDNKNARNGQAQFQNSLTLLEAVLAARRHQASNLSWQAIIDSLLLSILED